jgi:hypothetical protein
MIAAADLDARYVKAIIQHSVTVLQPSADGTRQPVYGQILGEMHSRGELHHYRVSAGDGTVLFVPPEWLHPDSRVAVIRAGLTAPGHLAGPIPSPQLTPSTLKQSEKHQLPWTTDARLAG